MRIKNIDITNFCGIEKLQMEFNEGVNLLIGNNGAGKTSLLKAVAVAIQTPVLLMPEVSGTLNISSDEAYRTVAVVGDVTEEPVLHFPVVIKGYLNWQGIEYDYHVECSSTANGNNIKGTSIAREFLNRFGEADQQYPILCFLQAGRGKVIKKNTSSVTFTSEKTQRNKGYAKAFSGTLNIDEIQQWCIQMEFAEFQKNKRIGEYSAFKSIVSKFLSFIENNEEKQEIYYSSVSGSLVYSNGKGEEPLYQMSAGYQAVLCMIIELAYRAVLLNPALENVASQVTGVVLIDEIEMHLHPAWQWKIVQALQNTFPKVQFIIATHSPIILSSAKGASLFLMRSPNEIEALENAYGYSVNDVLLLPQGSESQPPEVERYYEKIETALDRGSQKELERILKEAEQEFSNSPTVLKGLRDFVEVNRWVEEA